MTQEQIAKVLREAKRDLLIEESANSIEQREQWLMLRSVARRFADHLAVADPQFDRTQFLQDAGISK